MERNTDRRPKGILSVPVAAGALVEAGTIAATLAGYATEGVEDANLTYLGRFEETVDNSSGAAGDVSAKVRTTDDFQWKNSGTDPITQADFGKTCYIEDDVTVSRTDNTGSRSAAGTIVGVDSGGVWVSKAI